MFCSITRKLIIVPDKSNTYKIFPIPKLPIYLGNRSQYVNHNIILLKRIERDLTQHVLCHWIWVGQGGTKGTSFSCPDIFLTGPVSWTRKDTSCKSDFKSLLSLSSPSLGNTQTAWFLLIAKLSKLLKSDFWRTWINKPKENLKLQLQKNLASVG